MREIKFMAKSGFPSLARHPSPSRVMFMQSDMFCIHSKWHLLIPLTADSCLSRTEVDAMWQLCNAELPSYLHPLSSFDRLLRRSDRPVLCQLHDNGVVKLIICEPAAMAIAEMCAQVSYGRSRHPCQAYSPLQLTDRADPRSWERLAAAVDEACMGASFWEGLLGGRDRLSRVRSTIGMRRMGDDRGCEPALHHHLVTKSMKISIHTVGGIYCTLSE